MFVSAKQLLAAATIGTVGIGSVSGQVTEYTAGGLTNSWLDAANWNAGVPNSVTAIARVNIAGGPDLSGSATVDSVEVAGGSMIEVSLGSTLTVSGLVSTNNGVIDLNRDNSSVDSILDIPNTTTFSGSGAIRLFTSSGNSQIAGAGTLINGPAHAISGTGQINVGWINQGFIRADLGNGVRTLELREGGENQGLLSAVQTASGPSLLQVRGVPIVQTGAGSMSASDGGQIEFFGGTSVTGGTLNTAGGGFFDTTTGVVSFTDVINNGDLFVDFNSTLAIFGSGFVNNGTTTINNQNSSVNGIVLFEQSGTLGGTGEILMRVSADNSQINTADGVTMTHAASHTIRGVGQVNAAINNAGVIAADTAASLGTTTLELQTNDKANSGLLEARTGSILNIEAIEIDQTTEGVSAGRIEANDGTVSFFGAASVLGGEVSTSGTGVAGTRTSSTTTFDNVVLNADFFVDAGSTLLIDSGLVNNGTITINNQNSSSNGLLRTDQSIAITGVGAIIMRTNADNSRVETFDGGRITLGADQMILGVGEINADLVNNGVISADNSVALSFSDFELDQGPFLNNNRMTAESGSELRIEDVIVTQTPAANIESNDGLVTITSNTRIENGSLDSTGTGVFRTRGGTSELSNVTLNGLLQIEPGHTVRVDSGIVNNGLIEINRGNSSANSTLNLSDTSITGSGEVQLRTGATNSFVTADTGTVSTFGSGQLIRGVGVINGDFVNQGVVAADVAVALSGNDLDITGVTVTNNNELRAENGSILELTGSVVTQPATAGILTDGSGTIELLGNTTIDGGRLDSSGGGLWISAGDVIINGTELDGTGQINASTILRPVGGVLNNEAFITVNPQNSSGDAIILIEDNAVTTLDGNGTIDFFTSGFGNSRISPTTVGANEGTLVNGVGHTLTGFGTLQVATTNEGTISVGRPFGDFITNNQLTLASGGEMNVTISANNQNGQLDIQSSGNAVLGGTLNVLLADGAVLVNGNNHLIVDGSYSGTFDTENVLVDGQLITRVRYETDEVVLRTRCRADTNLDGSVTPADFNSWIAAFNMQDSVADQNLDGLVSPSDFNAWIINFNTPCP